MFFRRRCLLKSRTEPTIEVATPIQKLTTMTSTWLTGAKCSPRKTTSGNEKEKPGMNKPAPSSSGLSEPPSLNSVPVQANRMKLKQTAKEANAIKHIVSSKSHEKAYRYLKWLIISSTATLDIQ